MSIINRFTGTYAFLSNFYPCCVVSNGMMFHSVEAAFQAAKCANPEDQAQFLTLSPTQAKRRGRQVQMRADWDAHKLKVMYDLLACKFKDNLELRAKLLETGNAILVEGNTWHDNYWGCCTCPQCGGKRGRNNLGRLLMKLRSNLLKSTGGVQ